MKKRVVPMLLCMFLILGVIIPPIKVGAAIKELTVDESEYNLYIEDIPSFTSEWNSIFAKLNSVSDSSAYALSLFDDSDSTDLLVDGLNKANIKVDVDNVYGMDIMVYKLDDDGEYYPAEGTIDCTIICPVPDFWIDSAENLNLYQLSSSGKAQNYSFSLVSVNSVPCMKFTIKSTGAYGFVLTDSKVESSQEESTATKTPTKTPTKAPTQAPTPIPSNNSSNAAKPTATPTKAPAELNAPKVEQSQTNSNAVSNTVNQKHELDATPQTGDETPIGLWMVSGGLSASAILAILFILKHKR